MFLLVLLTPTIYDDYGDSRFIIYRFGNIWKVYFGRLDAFSHSLILLNRRFSRSSSIDIPIFFSSTILTNSSIWISLISILSLIGLFLLGCVDILEECGVSYLLSAAVCLPHRQIMCIEVGLAQRFLHRSA